MTERGVVLHEELREQKAELFRGSQKKDRRDKAGLTQLCDTLATGPILAERQRLSATRLKRIESGLWGSDRVLRSIQYGMRAIGGTPGVPDEARAVAVTFGSVFSQARYVTRIYGVLDGCEGLARNVGKRRPRDERLALTIQYGFGGVAFHVLENMALVLRIIRMSDENRIPVLKGALRRAGLWDAANDIDAGAQLFWLIEVLAKLYLSIKAHMENARDMREAHQRGDKARVLVLKREKAALLLDLVKIVCDAPLAVHFLAMYGKRKGTLPLGLVGLLGLTGSIAQFVVRFRKQA